MKRLSDEDIFVDVADRLACSGTVKYCHKCGKRSAHLSVGYIEELGKNDFVGICKDHWIEKLMLQKLKNSNEFKKYHYQ